MKRTLATLGVVGLGLISLTAPAMADRGHDDSDDKIAICHTGLGSNSGTYTLNLVAVPSLDGHDNHGNDIIPPHDGMDYGQNWDETGRAIYANGCKIPVVVPPVVVEPPVVNPPVVAPPVVEPPAVTPVVEQPTVTPDPVTEVPVVAPETPAVVTPVVEQPAVVAPAVGAGAAPAQPAAAGQPAARTGVPATATTSLGTNQGYNAQTAVGGAQGSPAWIGGLGALAAAGAAVAVRRRSGATS